MLHMVIFRTAEGKAGYHQTEGLDEAVRFVERLRNEEHVTNTRIFRMDEVPIEVKTYFKVEVARVARDEAPSSRKDDQGAAKVPAMAEAGGDNVLPASSGSSGSSGSNAGSNAGARFARFNRT